MVQKLKHFFWLCSGADIATLKKCETESSKYAGIGATIFFTGIFAALAGTYAIYTVFDNIYAALPFGLLWGLMIFNLDRYIVSSMKKRKKWSQELLMATPRLVLAILISIVIAKPLELKIFEKEIDGELLMMQQENLSERSDKVAVRFNSQRDQLAGEIERLKSEIGQKESQRDQLLEIARKEADGTGGTGIRSAGPIYKLKKADADQAALELAELKKRNEVLIQAKITQQDSLEAVLANELMTLEEAELGGMASRLEALSRLESKSEAIFIASLFIMFLFIAVECAPVLVKLMSPEGPYDYLMRADNHHYKAHHYEVMAKTNATIKHRDKKLASYEKDYLNEKLDLSLNDS